MAKDATQGPVTVGQSTGNVRMVNLPEGQGIPAAPQGPVKTVILAGGRGTRLMDQTKGVLPKPMVRVGDMPMLEHIMRIYSAQGFRNFVIAAGYLGEVIQEWVVEHKKLKEFADDVVVADTGIETQTGGRLARLAEHLADDYYFMLTYGDGFSDVNLGAALEYHAQVQSRTEQGIVTMTAARPPARFGSMRIENGMAVEFGEKIQAAEGWINAGFYVVDTGILNMIPGDNCRFEYDILPILATQLRLAAFQHPGFFQMCDNWRDWNRLKTLWASGDAPWARW